MSNENTINPFELDLPSDEQLGGESLSVGSLTDEHIDSELSIDIDMETSPESIIDSYITSLEEGEDVSLTDVTVKQMSKEGEKSKILGAVFKIDIGSGEAFDADTMVKETMEMDADKNASYLGEEENKPQVPPSFSKRDIDGLAHILATAKGNMSIRNLKEQVRAIDMGLVESVKRENVLKREYRQIESKVLALGEQYKNLSVAERELQLLNQGKQDLSVIMQLKERGVNTMTVTEDLERVKANVMEYQQKVKDIEFELAEIREKQMQLQVDKKPLLKQIESVMSNLDLQSAEQDILNNGSKVVGIEFGNKLISKDFKEAPVFMECQCGHVNHFDIGDMPKYHGIPVAKYAEFKSKIHDYSRNMISNLVYDGLSNLNKPKLVCSGCEKKLLIPPTILNDFVKRAFARETATIERYKNNPQANISGSQDGEVIMVLSENSFPSDYLKDLGVLKYYESKVRTINTDPLAELNNDASLTDKEERIVKLLNPNTDAEMISTYLRSHNNFIKSVNVYLDRLLKNHLKEKDNAKSEQAIKTNKLNRAMRRFIINNRWLLVSYCVIKQVPTMELQDKITFAYKSLENIRKFQNELFNFFIEHVIDSVVSGRDIVYVDTNRSTNLLEGTSTKLPHQVFFNKYRKLVSVYFKIRSQRVRSLSELETFKEVLAGVSEIPKIESKELAILKSETLVHNILKDLERLIDKDLSKNIKLRASVNELRLKITNSLVKSENSLTGVQYEDGKVFAWVAYEAKTNLENTVELNTNDEIYNKVYSNN